MNVHVYAQHTSVSMIKDHSVRACIQTCTYMAMKQRKRYMYMYTHTHMYIHVHGIGRNVSCALGPSFNI